jgi:hypothetical protein
MGNVTDQRDGQPFDVASMLSDRQYVEKTLSGVPVGTITSVEHTAIKFSRKQMGCARSTVSGHDPFNAHGFNCLRCVDKGFSLGDTAARTAELNGVSTQTLGCK